MSKPKLWSPLDPLFLQDPYPMYKRLREEDPVHQSQTGEWIISKYADVRSVLKSADFRSGNRLELLQRGLTHFKNKEDDLQFIYAAINSFVLFLNGADHLAIRNFVSRAWQHRDVEKLIQQNARDVLSNINTEQCDVIQEFARPLTLMTISRIMGIPEKEYHYLVGLSTTMMRAVDLYPSYRHLVELSQASKEFVLYFKNLIHKKTEEPDASLVSNFILSNQDLALREEQLISICIFLFIAGEETTTNSISTGLYHLLQHPAQAERLSTHPDELVSTVEELFRYDSPVQLVGRIAKTDVTVGGKVIPAESHLTLVLASANRDPLQFQNPDELDFHRSPNPHLTFGTGIHFCLGDWLGRMQTRIAVNSFITTFRSAKILPQDIRWNKNLSVRGLSGLLVKTRR